MLLTGSIDIFLFAIAAFVEESKAALTVPAVPAATAAVSRLAVASAEATPNTTLAPTPIPTVPKPVTVVNIQASNDTSSNDTALYSVLRIIGTGVTPFNLDRQKILLTALGYVISTVDLSNMYITDVNPVYASRRRQLLMKADNQQVTFCWLSLPSSSLLPAPPHTQPCSPCSLPPCSPAPPSPRPLRRPCLCRPLPFSPLPPQTCSFPKPPSLSLLSVGSLGLTTHWGQVIGCQKASAPGCLSFCQQMMFAGADLVYASCNASSECLIVYSNLRQHSGIYAFYKKA